MFEHRRRLVARQRHDLLLGRRWQFGVLLQQLVVQFLQFQLLVFRNVVGLGALHGRLHN
jgi:hypothetical protein